MALRFTNLENFKAAYVNVKDAEKNPMLEGYLAGAERFAERYTRRHFTPDPPLEAGGADTAEPIARTFRVLAGETEVRVPDLRAVVQLTLGGVAISEDDYVLSGTGQFGEYPASHVSVPRWYATRTLAVTGRWGWHPDGMEDILDAVYVHAARAWRERDAQFGDTVTTPEGMTFSYFRTMPSRVKSTYDAVRVYNFAFAGGIA